MKVQNNQIILKKKHRSAIKVNVISHNLQFLKGNLIKVILITQ